MSTMEHLKVDILFILGVVASLGVFFYYRPLIDDVHGLFLLLGALILVLAFAITKVETAVPKVPNFLLATGIGNVVLGIPTLGRGAPIFLRVPLAELTIGVFTEEIFRIAVAVWLFETLGSDRFAGIMSAITFAAMHFYWQPDQWITAILAGGLLTLLLFMYGSASACVATHMMFDFYRMAYMPLILYFVSSVGMAIIGYVLMRKIGGK